MKLIPALLLAACAVCACNPAAPIENSLPDPTSIVLPQPTADPAPAAEPDLRTQVDQALREVEVEGVRMYAAVSEEFPDHYNTLVEETVLALTGAQPEKDAGAAGAKFAVSLKTQYARNLKDAGPERIRTLLTTRRDCFQAVQATYGADACNEMARTDKMASDVPARIGRQFAQSMVATWSGMKAGLASPAPQQHPTRQDIQALAAAALNSGGPETAIKTWAADNVSVRGQECDLLFALLDAELAMTGPAGERLRAGSTLSLPFAQP